MKQHPDDAIIAMRLNALRERPIFNGVASSAIYVKQVWAVQKVREDPITGLPWAETVATFGTEQEAEAEARRLLGVTERSE